MTRRLPRALAALLAITVLAACSAGRERPPPRTGSTPILLIEYEPGLAPAAEAWALPALVLLADGTAISRAPDQGVLLAGETRTLSGAEVTDLYARAADAGLFDDRTYGRDGVLDAGALVVAIASDRGRHETTVVLPDPEDRGARGRVARFAAGVPTRGTPTGPYTPTAVAAVVVADGDDSSDVRRWPLATPAAEMPGAPTSPCQIISGARLPGLLAATGTATARTRWSSGGKALSLRLRPLLPYEHTCEDLRHPW